MSRALVIGGSMAGLCSAIQLRSHGFEVAVYERAAEPLANRGAGIATHPELYAALREAGVTLRDEMGVRCEGRLVLDATGAVIGRCEMPQLMSSWGLLYRFLRAQLPAACLHPAHALVDLAQDRAGVHARFANGSEAQGDWLIGADGTRSTVRTLVAPGVEPLYCGYFGWRGLVDERAIDSAVLAALAHRMTLCMAPGGHWLGYLVAGPDDDVRPGRRWYNWGWYRTADAHTLRDHLTDAAGLHHPNGIPPAAIRPAHVDAMRAEAARHLPPTVRHLIAATTRPFLQGMYDLGCERLVHGRVCLVGDAAFTVRPHVGLGVSKAAEDAALLGRALAARDQPAALARWEAARLRFGRAVLAHSRDLGSYLGPPPADEAGRAKAAYYSRPEVLMRATAPDDPLRDLERVASS